MKYKVGDEVWVKTKVDVVVDMPNEEVLYGFELDDLHLHSSANIIPSPIAKIRELIAENDMYFDYEMSNFEKGKIFGAEEMAEKILKLFEGEE